MSDMDVRAAWRVIERHGLAGLYWHELEEIASMARVAAIRCMHFNPAHKGEIHVKTEITHVIFPDSGEVVERFRDTKIVPAGAAGRLSDPPLAARVVQAGMKVEPGSSGAVYMRSPDGTEDVILFKTEAKAE